jgi:hypothetical protein
MDRLRSRWVRWVLLWTVVLLVIATVVAVAATASLYDAQQRCFLGYPSVPCPSGDDPRVGQLTLAFVGIPLVWLAGIGLTAVAWVVRQRQRR